MSTGDDKPASTVRLVAGEKKIDLATRLRIGGHMRQLLFERFKGNVAAMAAKLKISRQAVYRYTDGSRTAGFDTVLKIHRVLHVEIDKLVDDEPDVGYRLTAGGQISLPSQASLPAQAERQTPEGKTYLSPLDGQSEPQRGMQRVIRRRRHDKPASSQPGTRKAPKGRPPGSG